MEKLLNKSDTNVLKILDKNTWIWIIILSIPAFWALLVPGFYGASDDLHIAWLYELHKTLLLGQIPPRYVPDLSFGFGYPLFNFVFPLPFYLAEIFHIFGLSLVDSIKALFLITIPLSGLFMYFLLSQFTGRSWALAGALLYIYTPYRAVDLYVRGAMGEIVSFMFLPLLLLSIIKLRQNNNLKWIGVGAIALASLVLSHNITAYMFFPFAGLYFLLQVIFLSNNKRFASKTLLMVFLGLLISIYFWLPAVVDSNLMKYDTVFNFVDHFPTFLQLITPFWGYGASVPGPYDGMSFFLGLINIGMLVLGLILLILYWGKISKEQKIIIVWAVITIISAIFLMNYRSIFIWNKLPLLPYFQFPWRFLILTTFAIPIFVIVLEKLPFKFLPIVVIVTILLTAGNFFRPQDFLGRQDTYYLNRYIPIPVASSEYLKTQEEYLRLPKATEQRPNKNFPLLFPENAIKKVNKFNDLKVAFEYESDKEGIINLNKYYFPGWQAKIDGKSVKVIAGEPYGQVSILMPAGFHKAEVYFQETSLRSLLDFVSLGAFLVSLMILVV